MVPSIQPSSSAPLVSPTTPDTPDAPDAPVVVTIDQLRLGIDDSVLTSAFGPDSLGVILVNTTGSNEFLTLRNRVLSKASVLANLPQEQLSRLECKEAMWLIGWSCGKEKLANSGKADDKKGSFYINCAFHNDLELEGPRDEIVQKYAKHKAYTAKNMWPDELAGDGELEGFKTDCKKLINYIIDVAELVAENCDRYIAGIYENYEQGYLKRIVKESTCTKARLLHYFPNTDRGTSNKTSDNNTNTKNNDDDDWCGEHLDHSCLTGLTSALFIDESQGLTHALDSSPDPEAGLYIKSRLGNVVKVNIPKDHLAFQSGSALQEVSKGKFRAVLHYVKGTNISHIARNTLAVFCQPDLNEMINEKEDFAAYADRILQENH